MNQLKEKAVFQDVLTPNIKSLLKNIDRGLILLVGVVGTGKSTAQIQILEFLAETKGDTNITNICDVIEYVRPGINQIAINNSGERISKLSNIESKIVGIDELRDIDNKQLEDLSSFARSKRILVANSHRKVSDIEAGLKDLCALILVASRIDGEYSLTVAN